MLTPPPPCPPPDAPPTTPPPPPVPLVAPGLAAHPLGPPGEAEAEVEAAVGFVGLNRKSPSVGPSFGEGETEGEPPTVNAAATAEAEAEVTVAAETGVVEPGFGEGMVGAFTWWPVDRAVD